MFPRINRLVPTSLAGHPASGHRTSVPFCRIDQQFAGDESVKFAGSTRTAVASDCEFQGDDILRGLAEFIGAGSHV